MIEWYICIVYIAIYYYIVIIIISVLLYYYYYHLLLHCHIINSVSLYPYYYYYYYYYYTIILILCINLWRVPYHVEWSVDEINWIEIELKCFNFCWLMVLRSVEINWIISGEYGDRILPKKSIYALLNWWRILEYPSTLTNEGNIEQVHASILNSSRVTTNKMINHLWISHGSAYEIICHKSHFCKICARWVPKQPTEWNRCNCV
jgi:hypothetical protein